MSIVKLSLTEKYSFIRGVMAPLFCLSDLNDSADNLYLLGGKAEEVNLELMYTTKDTLVTDFSATGDAYLYLTEFGGAFANNTEPVYNGRKGGMYFGDNKCIYKFKKLADGSRINKQRIGFIKGNILSGDVNFNKSINFNDGFIIDNCEIEKFAISINQKISPQIFASSMRQAGFQENKWYFCNGFIKDDSYINMVIEVMTKDDEIYITSGSTPDGGLYYAREKFDVTSYAWITASMTIFKILAGS